MATNHQQCMSFSLSRDNVLLLRRQLLGFSWGGGGAHLKIQDRIINVGMIGYASSEDTGIRGVRGNFLKFQVHKLLEMH